MAIIGDSRIAEILANVLLPYSLAEGSDIWPAYEITNGFSKKVENLEAAVALHYMHYNFCRIHQMLRVTPAMEAGLSDHVWSLNEVIALLS